MSLQWLSLVGSIWLQSTAGTNSNFPAYSSKIKNVLSISQVQLNNLAFASDAGKLLGWFSGVASIYLPLWLVLLIGTTLGLIGYGVQFLFLINQISSLSYWHIFMLTFLAGNSICWINTVCYIIVIKNFPLDRLIAVGLSTSYASLSAKIVTDMVNVVNFVERDEAYLLLNSVLPLVVAVVVVPLVRAEAMIGKSRSLNDGFRVFFVITIATGAYAVTTSLETAVTKLLSRLMILIGMLVLLILPIVVPLEEVIKENWQKKCWIRRESRICDLEKAGATATATAEVVAPPEDDSGDGATAESGGFGVDVMEEIGAKKMLMRLNFWLYFLAYFFGATVGLVYLNNLGQIADSRGFRGTSSLVSLSSSFGFFGRLLPSLFDYFLSKSKYAISRPASIAATHALMTGAFFLLLHDSHISLYVSTAIIGICTGAVTSISVSQTTELFGTKNFGINHNIVVANIPIGSFLFGDMAAMIYKRQRNYNSRDDTCLGMKCFQTTFLIWGCLCFLGTCLAYILHVRTRKFYNHIRG